MVFEVNVGGIEGLCVIEPNIFYDKRGYFTETYNKEVFDYFTNKDITFVQDNESVSTKGVLRGLHFQDRRPQGKLVRVVEGEVFDVAVDLRKNSPTFGKWYGLILSEENKKQFYIPEGFAHGFLVLSDRAKFCYKCTNYYDPDGQCGLFFGDKEVGIEWPKLETPLVINERDWVWPTLEFLAVSRIEDPTE